MEETIRNNEPEEETEVQHHPKANRLKYICITIEHRVSVRKQEDEPKETQPFWVFSQEEGKPRW